MKFYPYISLALGALVGAGCVGVPSLSAQPAASVAVDASVNAPASLDDLVAPIALYPDALVALILPASTNSSEVVLAARFLNGGGDPGHVDAQSWDDSVKGLAHFPEVVKWMDVNLEWTRAVGDAYADHPDDVMAAIQRVRSRAMANGVLVSTQQQQVLVENGFIRIIPAQPDVVYVPRYDPQIIYVDQPFYEPAEPWLTFGIGFSVGWWLSYDCDWGHRRVVFDRNSREHWRPGHDWRQPELGRPGYVSHNRSWQPWTPQPGRARPSHRDIVSGRREIVRPEPLPGAHLVGRDARHDRPGNSTDGTVQSSPWRSPRSDTPQSPYSRNQTSPGSRNAIATPVAPFVQPRVETPRNDTNVQQRHPPTDRPAERVYAPAPEARSERILRPMPARPAPVQSAPVREQTVRQVTPPPAAVPVPAQPTSRAPAVSHDRAPAQNQDSSRSQSRIRESNERGRDNSRQQQN